MPSEIMDQRHLSSVCMASAPSSFFSSGLCFPNERQAECWKPDSLPHYPGTGLAGEMGSNSVEPLKHFDLFDQDMAPWKAARQETALKSTLQSTQLKNDLFSSSLLETFGRKLILSSSDHLRENGYQDEPLESSREIEARVIGDLLPDDDELISGVTDGMEYIAQQNYDDTEDDFFCSIGGMELEANDVLDPSIGVANCQHLSRNFFVGNIDGSVEDSELRALFEQYGSIRNLYTACKLRGFVRVSYYDLRSACSAVKSLQSKTLRSRKLDLQFSFPKQDNLFEGDVSEGIVEIFSLDFSVSNDDLLKIFASFGDVKEVREIPHKRHHKLIEFYDVRAAEAVLHGSNGTEFLGNKIRVLSPKPRAPRWSVNQQLSPDLEQRESTRCCQLASPNNHGSINHGAISPYLHSPHRPLDNGHFPHSLSSPLLVSSSGNMGGFAELDVNHNGLANGLGSPYSRSLPEYHDCPTSRLPVNSLGPIPYTTINPNHVHGVCTDGVNSHPFDYNHGLRASMTRNAWSSGIPYQHQQQPRHSQGSPMWSNSPSLVNFAGSPSQAHGSMINGPFLPVGSAPSGNNLGSTLWDRRAGGPHFHLGLHPLELSSQGFGPARYSPQQRAQTVHGRNPMIPPLSPFESPNERARVRRSDSSSNQAENKRQFELDIERIIRGEDCRTTLMIKNIPNKYTSKMLLAAIDENHHGTYDFIYLPIDFKNKCNVGYAFINMVDPEKIIPFFETFNGKKWEKFNSEKVASLAYGRIQGKAALIAHFQNSSLMNEDKRCRPILFQTEGPNAGDQEPFPMGANVRPRHAKSRTNSYPSSPSPATSPDGDGSPNGTDSSSGSPSD